MHTTWVSHVYYMCAKCTPHGYYIVIHMGITGTASGYHIWLTRGHFKLKKQQTLIQLPLTKMHYGIWANYLLSGNLHVWGCGSHAHEIQMCKQQQLGWNKMEDCAWNWLLNK